MKPIFYQHPLKGFTGTIIEVEMAFAPSSYDEGRGCSYFHVEYQGKQYWLHQYTEGWTVRDNIRGYCGGPIPGELTTAPWLKRKIEKIVVARDRIGSVFYEIHYEDGEINGRWIDSWRDPPPQEFIDYIEGR